MAKDPRKIPAGGKRERQERCELCKYWIDEGDDAAHGEAIGTCRRSFPRLVAKDANFRKPRAVWPFTSFNDWCGEYDRRTGQ